MTTFGIRRRAALGVAGSLGLMALTSTVRGQVTINEFQYDEVGTDAREFVELYNSGAAPVSIENWTLTSYDTNINATVTLPVGASIPAGGYYLITPTGSLIPGANFSASFGTITEDDGQDIWVLKNGAEATGTVVDAVAYETNKSITAFPIYSSVQSQLGKGVWSNHQSTDQGTNAVSASVGRYIDGHDTNVNGRDFGFRPATPGSANATSTFSTYAVPNVDALNVGDPVPGYSAGFQGDVGQPYAFPAGTRTVDPTVVSTFNPKAIPASPQGGKVITMSDTSGGGNGASTSAAFQGAASFNIDAYLDTTDLAAAEHETTTYQLGSADALQNIPDPEGDIIAGTAITAAGNTGLGWMFQKFGTRAMLYLFDAKDGGNSASDATPLDWNYIQKIDLSAAASGWHQLAISIGADGTGFANFDGTIFPFTTAADQTGAFSIGYREAIAGSPGAPGTATFRPPTFDISLSPIPEPATISLLSLAGVGLIGRRRQRRA